MRILLLSNIYPPHHAGTYDYRMQIVAQELGKRGHQVHILTSNHGIKGEQVDHEISRRLWLNGAYGHPLETSVVGALKDIEFHNNEVLREAIEKFYPNLVLVGSMRGLSKSLLFTLERTGLPVVYDVADDWLSSEIRRDPWLNFWNCEKLSFKEGAIRKSLEMSGQRNAYDEQAPTRFDKDIKRMPYLFTGNEEPPPVEPDTIRTFAFDRIYFSSLALKSQAVDTGFFISHAEVIQPLIMTDTFKGAVKAASHPTNRFMLFNHLEQDCGAMTALRAFHRFHQSNPQAILNIHGLGDTQYMSQLKSYAVQNSLPVEIIPVSDPVREMPNVFPQYDVYLHTTEWPEPFTAKPLEAMACGLAVIGNCTGGVGSFLFHQQNCLTYLAGSEDDLAEKMETLYFDPDLRVRIATKGQEIVTTGHNLGIVMDRIEDYLNETLQVWS